MSDLVLQASDISKCYPIGLGNLQRVARWYGLRRCRPAQFWALRNVSLSVSVGEAIALIGLNGSGKSTALKILSGIVRATSGGVARWGRTQSILELGLGFNPELTGRQNVVNASAMMGFGAEAVSELVPAIVDFAELADCQDQPVRAYSSGMQARLAFAIATATRPDLLIVDEVLTVGDSYFQHKSFNRIKTYKAQGTALVFVSHSMEAVQSLCDRAIMLHEGHVVREGAPRRVIDFYNAFIAKRQKPDEILQTQGTRQTTITRSGTGEAAATSIAIVDADSGEKVSVAAVGQQLAIELQAMVRRPVARMVLGLMVRDRTGHVVWGSNTYHTHQTVDLLQPGEVVDFRVRFKCALGPGSYALTYALTEGPHHTIGNYEWVDNCLVFDVVNLAMPTFVGSSFLDAQFEIRRSNA